MEITQKYCSPKEASKILGISTRTVCRYAKRGAIPHLKLGRNYHIKRSYLEKLGEEKFSKEDSFTLEP